MIFYKLSKDLREEISHLKAEGKTIGFVPTMGALHAGHLSLIQASAQKCDITVCSIFVNPSQFNNADDLKNYPRTLPQDLALLTGSGCDLVYAPHSVDDVYQTRDDYSFELGNLDKVMEGTYRPGHFNGVVNVVKRFFDIIGPDRAFFGQKDFQQCLVIKKLIEHYQLKVQLEFCPIARETDGLAMSSRNVRLTPRERSLAPFIFQTLIETQGKRGEQSPAELKQWVLNQFSGRPEFSPEYFEIAETENLMPVNSWEDDRNIVACIAVKLGAVRLIDNIILK